MILLKGNQSLKRGTINNYKVGDYVRLYVVIDDPTYQEAKMIRVR